MPQLPMIQIPPAPHFDGFPHRDNCNPDDPYQFALWALVPLPTMRHVQLKMLPDYLQLVSKRLWDLGFRHVLEPVLLYRPPIGHAPYWLDPGDWVTGGPDTEVSPPPFLHGLPRRENCNPNDPYQFALWALVALPNMAGGQLVMSVEYLQMVSKQLWDLGFRHVEDPVLRYRPPRGPDSYWLGVPGDWIPIDKEEAS